MEIIQKGFSCSYDLEIFKRIYFNDDEDGVILTNLTHKNDIINVYVEIIFGGKSYFEDCDYPFRNDEKDEKLIKKYYTCSVTKTFVKAAKKIRNIENLWGVMSGIRPAKVVSHYKKEGKSEEEIKDIFKNLYDVSKEKTDLAIKVSENEEKILENIKKNSVSIYIGIPFCPSRCSYCSFVSTDIKTSGKYMDEFVDLLVLEIEKTKSVLDKCSLFVENIYIGGGTPTTLSCKNLEKIFNAINKYLKNENLNEYTLEAGRPDTITKEKLICAKNAGVNRISINPQTMNDVTLEKIGRKHSSDMVKDAYFLARECGFDVINMDLIAGLPGEDFNMYKYSLDEVVKLNPENITVHCMCIKKASSLDYSFSDLTNSNQMNKMLSYTTKTMEKTNKEPYYMYRQKNISANLENVGYSTKETKSFYNVNIMEEAQTIIGLGGGAVSKIVMGDRIERIFNFKDPYEYIKRFSDIISKKDEILKFYEE